MGLDALGLLLKVFEFQIHCQRHLSRSLELALNFNSFVGDLAYFIRQGKPYLLKH